MEAKIDDVIECVICMEPPSIRGKIQSCDHVFCFECIKKWSEHENSCPLCKKRFRQIDKITLGGNLLIIIDFSAAIHVEVLLCFITAKGASLTEPDRKSKRKRSSHNSEETVKVNKRDQSQALPSSHEGFMRTMMATLFGDLMGGGLEALRRDGRRELQLPVHLQHHRLQHHLQRNSFNQANAYRDHVMPPRPPIVLRRNEPGTAGTTVENPELIDSDDDEVIEIVGGSTSAASSSSGSSEGVGGESVVSGAVGATAAPRGARGIMPSYMARMMAEHLGDLEEGDEESDCDFDEDDDDSFFS
jgi:hypothetical protein